MSLLSISPFQILFTAFAVAVLHISAIMILFRNKSGFLPYMALVLIPVLARWESFWEVISTVQNKTNSGGNFPAAICLSMINNIFALF